MMKKLTLLPVSVLKDNYVWLLHDGENAWIVDPGEAAPVVRVLESLNLSLQAILVTHHHGDHVAGIAALVKRYAAQVFGPARERVKEVDRPLQDGGSINAAALQWRVFDVPGHTSGHIAFYAPQVPLKDGDRPVLFCGDTLFSGGCGRLLEGTPQQMLQSLDRLAELPGNTLVCCGHEYTVANLEFALAVEPRNPAVLQALEDARELRAKGQSTLPGLLGREREINPFLRSRCGTVRAAVEEHAGSQGRDDVEWFGLLRAWKNNF